MRGALITANQPLIFNEVFVFGGVFSIKGTISFPFPSAPGNAVLLVSVGSEVWHLLNTPLSLPSSNKSLFRWICLVDILRYILSGFGVKCGERA